MTSILSISMTEKTGYFLELVMSLYPKPTTIANNLAHVITRMREQRTIQLMRKALDID